MNTLLGYRVQSLFDTVQTHAVYEVPDWDVARVKVELKKLGATHFRVVKVKFLKSSNLRIVCFKAATPVKAVLCCKE